MPAAFSRLQLAAALIEYDNDSEDPAIPHRSAQESAIFAHLRRNPAARPEPSSRHSNRQGGRSDLNSQNGRESALGTRRSRGSVDAMRNPFAADGGSEYDDEEETQSDLEVDLSSWGLDAFIPKEKGQRPKKGKEKQGSVPVRSRAISNGPQDVGPMANAIAHSRSASTLNMKRMSTSSRLELGEDNAADSLHRRRAASQSTIPVGSPTGTVAFPSHRPQTPTFSAIDGEQDQHVRSQSRASIGSRALVDEYADQRPRSMSQGTVLDQHSENNPFALPTPAQTSRFDPKGVHTRTYSNGSLGTRHLLDNEEAESVHSRESLQTRNRPYSVVELLRPKVLVMPSPLQSSRPPQDEPTREGFQLSRDGPPLPPGARTSRRLSMNLDSVPNPSNSFIPNPAADLSLAQKVFRNTLVAHQGGQYLGPESLPPRAINDGEQIEFEPPPVVVEDETLFYGAEEALPKRPAGKLYGKSLIDDLEARKAQMRGRQRQFTGDQRPTMMARENARASTWIDPATLIDKPRGPHAQGANLTRRGSSNVKPLLSFDDGKNQLQPPRLTKNASVFGVDTLWEREMAKLRELQEQEMLEEERRRKVEEEEARLKAEKDRIKKRKKQKKKGIVEPEDQVEIQTPSPPLEGDQVHIPDAPPILPDIKRAVVRRAPQVEDDDESSESDAGDVLPPRKPTAATTGWHSDSEDEDKAQNSTGPLRTTGVGLRNPQGPVPMAMRNSDSEEDVPLSTAKYLAASRLTRQAADSDEDEDKPLSRVLENKLNKSPMIDINFDKAASRLSHPESDEDEQPLALRASRLVLNPNADDDDKPLAFHPEQQRRTQYSMLAAQQQHSQLMMQAQFQNSMYFNNPMMAPPFFAPTMMNPMAMMPAPIPIPIPSPPPLHDEAKFRSVDRWRRDVVVDGESQR
ncbi:hypothetical protein FA15DRAFT_664801 [Coprinopsis marcescibilis]|uniref:Uncharacterized protein n=1 Tax=Coprinopsis marcescibilis TaxID=230819 RepID=A0A5C3L7U2_COPMA|nr:hypothetical protein FA15DRAFT_664801 [Coprinopsis marcescibilis]